MFRKELQKKIGQRNDKYINKFNNNFYKQLEIDNLSKIYYNILE